MNSSDQITQAQAQAQSSGSQESPTLFDGLPPLSNHHRNPFDNNERERRMSYFGSMPIPNAGGVGRLSLSKGSEGIGLGLGLEHVSWSIQAGWWRWRVLASEVEWMRLGCDWGNDDAIRHNCEYWNTIVCSAIRTTTIRCHVWYDITPRVKRTTRAIRMTRLNDWYECNKPVHRHTIHTIPYNLVDMIHYLYAYQEPTPSNNLISPSR